MGAGAAPTAGSKGTFAKATAVTAGLEHTCALTASGAVKYWGYNGHGELGTAVGSVPWSSTPLDLADEGLISGVHVLSGGLRHSCAVTGSGGAMCWGVNYGGASGDGTGEEHLGPVHVLGLRSGVSTVSAGYDRACALLATGGVKCWGIGYGLAPIDIPGLNGGVLALSARHSIGCAITTAREIKCWGGHYGSTPVNVPELSGVIALATGYPYCALTGSGSVKCWGGDYGWTPVDVPGLSTGVRAVGMDGLHGCALMKAVSRVKLSVSRG